MADDLLAAIEAAEEVEREAFKIAQNIRRKWILSIQEQTGHYPFKREFYSFTEAEAALTDFKRSGWYWMDGAQSKVYIPWHQVESVSIKNK